MFVKNRITCFDKLCIVKKGRMKMNAKRFSSLLLVLVMLLALTACGGKSNSNANSNNAQSDGQQSENAPSIAQLRVGMECAYAPNNWQESEATDTNVPIENVPGGYAEGYDVQFARIIAEQLGRELVIVKLSWDGLIDALNQGQIDAIIAGMMDTAERRESINFSDAYHETVYGIMLYKDSEYVGATSINDFAGASVLGQKDTALDTVIDQMAGVNHLTPVDSVPDMISRLQQHACDALVINVENSDGYLVSNPDFVVLTFGGNAGFELPAAGACVGLRKSDTALLEQVNAALATVDNAARDEMWKLAVETQPQ